jgi:hypothetical protein
LGAGSIANRPEPFCNRENFDKVTYRGFTSLFQVLIQILRHTRDEVIVEWIQSYITGFPFIYTNYSLMFIPLEWVFKAHDL